MAADASAPRPSRRAPLLVTAIVVVVAVVYVVVVALYALGAATNVAVADATSSSTDAEALIAVRPQAVDAATDRLTLIVDLEVRPEALSDDGLAPDRSVFVLVSGAAGSRTLEFPASQVLSPVSVALITDGVVEQWPFDVHRATTTLMAYQVVDDVAEILPTRVVADGRVPGWSIDARVLDSTATVVIDGEPQPLPVIEFSATRAGSTVAFGLVLLALMVIIPTVVLSVAILVYRGRRRVEPSFLGWIGAMLFATIPMRTFLPGSPPIGSWIDFLVVLWVFVALVAGLIVYVAAWARWSSPVPERMAAAEQSRAPEPASSSMPGSASTRSIDAETP